MALYDRFVQSRSSASASANRIPDFFFAAAALVSREIRFSRRPFVEYESAAAQSTGSRRPQPVSTRVRMANARESPPISKVPLEGPVRPSWPHEIRRASACSPGLGLFHHRQAPFFSCGNDVLTFFSAGNPRPEILLATLFSASVQVIASALVGEYKIRAIPAISRAPLPAPGRREEPP